MSEAGSKVVDPPSADGTASSASARAEAERIAHLGYWHLDLKRNTLVWSDEIYRLFEIDPRQFGASYEAFLAAIHPEDREYVNKAYSESVKSRAPYDIVHRLLMKDGRVKYVNERCETFYDSAGQPQRSIGTVQDITEQRLTFEALRASEARLRVLYEETQERARKLEQTERIANVGSWEVDLGANRLIYSDEALRIHGLSRDAFDGTLAGAIALAHPEDRLRLTSAINATLYEGKSFDIEYRIVRSDGSVRFVHAQDEIVRDAAGRPVRAFGVTQDITERKLAEQDLRRFRLAMDASIDSVYLTDPATMRFVDVNNAACQRLGYTREQLLGMGPQDALGIDRAQIEREYENVIAAGERGVKTENTYRANDGGRGWTELYRRAFRVEGNSLIITIGRDITERKRAQEALLLSEQRFRSLTQLSSDWYWEMDEDYRFRPLPHEEENKTQFRAPGYVGKTPWEIPGTSVSEPQWASYRAGLDARQTFRDFEFSRPSADGALRWVSISGEPIFDDASQFKGYRGVGSDITKRKLAEESLRESESHLRLLVDNVPAMIAYVDADKRYRYVNRRYLDFYAQNDSPIDGKTLDEVLGEETWRTARAPVLRALSGEAISFQGSRRRRDGRVRAVDVSLVPNKSESGHVLGVYILAIDVTRRQRAEKMLRLRNRAVESSVNSIIITEPAAEGQKITYVNPAFERITGYSASEAVGRSPRFLHSDDTNQPVIEELRTAVREHRDATVLLRNYRKDGTLFWNELRIAPVRDEGGSVTHFIGVGSDVTDRVHYEGEIERSANYDALTGLPNRNLLTDRLAQAVANVERTKAPAAVLYIDLDQFKRINDSLGHAIGDQVITSMGARLAAVLRSGDTVARWGGDEFVAVLTNLTREDDITHVAEKLRRAVCAPLTIEGREFVISASVGVAVAPKDGSDGPMLLRNADAALYRAKEQGRDCFRFFAAEMNEHAVRYLSLEQDLRAALNASEFWLQYQPIVMFATGEAVGVEALIRWRRQDGTIVSPADFIPVAEESGLIVPIGRWVLETAAQQAAVWSRGRKAPLYVSVNLSARQFRDPGLVEMVRIALQRAQLDPSLIKLEITESTVMQNAEEAVRTLRGLNDLGVLLSVDDFGTGYSSLSYLKRFPIDTLKIDRSFVRDLPADRDDLAICRAVIDMAQGLGLDVVAEGIETTEQADMLSTHGCQFAQGFLFSRPIDPEALEELIRSPLSARRGRKPAN